MYQITGSPTLWSHIAPSLDKISCVTDIHPPFYLFFYSIIFWNFLSDTCELSVVIFMSITLWPHSVTNFIISWAINSLVKCYYGNKMYCKVAAMLPPTSKAAVTSLSKSKWLCGVWLICGLHSPTQKITRHCGANILWAYHNTCC